MYVNPTILFFVLFIETYRKKEKKKKDLYFFGNLIFGHLFTVSSIPISNSNIYLRLNQSIITNFNKNPCLAKIGDFL